MRGCEGRAFNQRAFVALLAAASALGLAATGMGSHLHHSGPLAHGRHAWVAAHLWMAALFLASGTWHAVLNGNALLRYLRGYAGRVMGLSREAAWAVGVVALALLLAVLRGPYGR